MRSKFLGGIFLFFLFFIATLAHAAESEGFPSADVPEPSYTFESAVEGVFVTHDFMIRNRGTAPLTISKVKTG